MERRSLLPSFYDIYQTIIAIIGMVGICRMLMEFSWTRSIVYSVVTLAAYWLGNGIVALVQKLRAKAKVSTD